MPTVGPEQNGKNDAEYGSGNSIEDSPIQAVLQKEQGLDKQVEDDPSSANSERTDSSSQTCSSAVEKKDLNLDIECDIRWEDLHIGEEIGQGNCALVVVTCSVKLEHVNIYLFTFYLSEENDWIISEWEGSLCTYLFFLSHRNTDTLIFCSLPV